jgi:hypothetical protein
MRLLRASLLAVALIVGCSGGQSIPGVYICSAQLNNYTAQYDIRQDGTAILSERSMMRDTSCTWIFETNTVIITPTNGETIKFRPEGKDLILLNSTVWLGAQSRFVRIR